MFLHLTVSHSVHGGGWCLPHFMLGYTPLGRRPPPHIQTPHSPSHTTVYSNKRAVRILLKCILELLMQ